MEGLRIVGVVHHDLEVKIMLHGLPRRHGAVAAVLDSLADAGTGVLLVELRTPDGVTGRRDIVFTVDRLEGRRVMRYLWDRRMAIGFVAMRCDETVRRVSLLGENMRSHGGIVARFVAAVAEAGVRSELVSVSSDEIAAIVPAGGVKRAVTAVRDEFGVPGDPLAAWDGDGEGLGDSGLRESGMGTGTKSGPGR